MLKSWAKRIMPFLITKVQAPLSFFDDLINTPVLFIIAVYNDVVTTGVWEKVGKLPIREDLKILPNQFIYHKNENPEYELYNTET